MTFYESSDMQIDTYILLGLTYQDNLLIIPFCNSDTLPYYSFKVCFPYRSLFS